MSSARIGFGLVRHQRLAPVGHAFAYPVSFLMLPMRALRRQPDPQLRRNQPSLFGFHDRDHGDGGDDALAWLDRTLAEAGISDADGEVWLHTFPRQLGYAFKPVSFWYAHRADGPLAAILVEVNNTFGERHAYLLEPPGLDWGRTLVARKVFHVSPFASTEGEYRFRFLLSGPADAPGRTVARVEWHVDGQPRLLTSVSGELEPLTAAARRRALLSHPLMTLGISARILWQALRLWGQRRLPVVPWRASTAAPLTRGGAPAASPLPPVTSPDRHPLGAAAALSTPSCTDPA